MKGRKKRINAALAVFPLVGMAIIAGLEFLGFFIDLPEKNIIIKSLVFVFPGLFFAQGLLCSIFRKSKTEAFLAIGLSVAAFAGIVLGFLNFTAWPFVVVYSGLWALGYFIGALAKKISKL